MRSRSRVGVGGRTGSRAFRLGIEALETRLVLSGIAPSWVTIGPSPITDPFGQNLNYNGTYVNPPQITGAIQTVATYQTPQGTQGAYVGGAIGGVWETQDLFASSPTWSTHTDGMPSLAINTLGISPLDPTGATVFAGTGPTSNGGLYWHGYGSFPDLSALETGLYLSTNAGQSWTALNNATSPVYGTFISKVLPTSIGAGVTSETVLVGTENGLFVSADGGSTFAPQNFTNPVLDVVADPLNSQRFYLLAGPDGNGNGAGVYLSDNAGQSWTSINGGAIDAQVIALIPTNGESNGAGRLAATTENGKTLLYMSFERSDNQNTYGVFRSAINSDGTADWKAYYTFSNQAAGGGGNNLGLAVDPSNPDFVYTAGYGDNSTYRIGPDPSTGDVTPTRLTNEDAGSLYDTRAIAFATDPNGHEVLVQTSDSGVYGLTDPTTASELPTWKPLMGNISVTESYSVAAMAGPLGQLYVGGGAQDTAAFQTSVSSAGQSSWVAVNGGDGYGSAYDPSGYLYATSDTLSGIQIAEAGSNTIEPVTLTGFNKADDGAGAFPSLVAVSAANVGGPFTPRPVVFAAFGLYEAVPASLTSGQISVTQINAPVKDGDTYSALSFGGTYQGAPDPYVLYAAQGDGTLWYSDTLGAQVTKLTGWTQGTIVGLQQDPTNSHHVYALTKTGLYVTEDAGQTWSAYATPPPSATLGSFMSLGLVPTTVGGTATNLLMVGGVHGAMALPDDPALGLSSWSPLGANLPNAIVTGFAYVPSLDDLVLSTFGRGDWLVDHAATQLLYPISGQSATSLSVPTTSTWGVSTLLSAQVSSVAPGQSTPTGSVNFLAQTAGNPSLLLGSAPLDSTGNAHLLLPQGLPPGVLTIRAIYLGDSNYAGSQDQASTTVNPAVTVIGLTTSGAATATSPLTLAAQVNATSGNISPPGRVTFLDGSTTLATVTLNATGQASLSLPSLAPGAHSLSARYTPAAGSPFTASQTTTPTALTVTPVATTVGLIAPASAVSSTPVRLTAIVGASGASAVGSVTFFDGNTALGTVTVNSASIASLTVPSFSIGTHSLRATYHPAAGSPFLPGATLMWTTVRVAPDPSVPVATTTTLTAAHGSSPFGRRPWVRFGVQVEALPAMPASGLVELMGRGRVLVTASLDGTGRTTFILPASRVLNQPITAIYLGGSVSTHPAAPSVSSSFTPTVRWLRSPTHSAVVSRHAPSPRARP